MPRRKQTKAKHQNKKQRQRRPVAALRQLPRPVRIILVIAFAICFGMLLQQAVIISLDRDVNELTTKVEAQQAINDSKEGRIIRGQNLDTVEEEARAYGMTEPTQDQYQYVIVDSKDSDTSLLDTFRARINAFVKQIQSSGASHGKTSQTNKNQSK